MSLLTRETGKVADRKAVWRRGREAADDDAYGGLTECMSR
jgi:hypothetical protein